MLAVASQHSLRLSQVMRGARRRRRFQSSAGPNVGRRRSVVESYMHYTTVIQLHPNGCDSIFGQISSADLLSAELIRLAYSTGKPPSPAVASINLTQTTRQTSRFKLFSSLGLPACRTGYCVVLSPLLLFLVIDFLDNWTYLRKYWTDLHQIFRIGRRIGLADSDTRFVIV